MTALVDDISLGTELNNNYGPWAKIDELMRSLTCPSNGIKKVTQDETAECADVSGRTRVCSVEQTTLN